KYKRGQANPRHPGFEEPCSTADAVGGGERSGVALEFPPLLRLPNLEQRGDGGDRTNGSDDVHEPGSMKVRDEKLRDRERQTRGQSCRPDSEHSAEAGHRPNNPKWNEQGEKRKLASDHLGEG